MPGVRRGIAGTLLLGCLFFVMVVSHLDTASLERHVIAQIEKQTGGRVHAGQASLSLQRGVSLKLTKFSIAGSGDWRMDADIARFDIAFFSLVSGHPRVASIDLVHPVAHVDAAASPLVLVAGPPAARMLQHTSTISVRQGQVWLRDVLLLDELSGTLRRNDREHQTTWELQSRYAGGDFTSQGYVRAMRGSGDRVFGRITGTQLQLRKMQNLPLPLLHYDTLDASLTFSYEPKLDWQWSGNMSARDAHGVLPELSWRGKVSGRALDDFTLHDAFMRLGDQTRLELAGGCEKDQPCRMGVSTRGADAGIMLKALGVAAPFSGKLDSELDLTQQAGDWQLDGKFGLRSSAWDGTGLPDSVTDVSNLRIVSSRGFTLAHAEVRPAGDAGSLEIDHLHRDGNKLAVTLRMHALSGAWAPLGGLLLARAGIAAAPGKPGAMQGTGVLDGLLQIKRGEHGSLLRFSLDAGQASLQFGSQFSKPAGVPASVQGYYRREDGRSRLELGKTQLASTSLSGLSLRFGDANGQARDELSFSDASVVPAEMYASKLVLPAALQGWQGKLHGSLARMSLPKGFLSDGADVLQALAGAGGDLQLDGFGRGGQVWSGALQVHDGHARGAALHWQHDADSADFAANVRLVPLSGDVDIRRAALGLNAVAGLPDWLAQSGLRGRFDKVDLHWDGNLWSALQGRFETADGKLKLERITGSLAGGAVRSRSLQIGSAPGGVHVAGRLGMTAVQLDKLAGLDKTFGVRPVGYAFVNARLDGSLPLGSGAWQGNGDVAIQRGHVPESDEQHRVLWLNPAAAKLAPGRFDRLDVRFRMRDGRLQLNRIKLAADKLSGHGEATVTADGDIHGHMKLRAPGGEAVTGLGGHWSSAVPLLAAPVQAEAAGKAPSK